MEFYIPSRAKTEKEIINNFGGEELKKFTIGMLFCVALCALLHLIFGELTITIIALIISAFVCFTLCSKIENLNQSVIDILLDIIRFKNSQKIYPYIYMDEWGIE